MKNLTLFSLVMLAVLLLVGGVSCSRNAPTPTPTLTSTFTPTPTSTPTPLPTPTPTPTIQPGEHSRFINVDGLWRSYVIYIPSGLRSLDTVPVVFTFHPWFGSSSDMILVTGFNRIAEDNNFLIIYPEAIDLSWNAGGCCDGAMEKKIDEVAFVRQMLSDLGTLFRVDPKRTFATGWSNGGILAYRLACEMSDTFAAIAPVAGPLWYSPCQPQQPVSVMHVHGMLDTTCPFEGGKSDLVDLGLAPQDFKVPSVEQGIATWVQLDGCTGSPVEEKQAVTTHISYQSCQAGTTIELYKIDGQDHWYPIIFPTSQKIWEFFAAHPKP